MLNQSTSPVQERFRVAMLSERERQVLTLLAAGLTGKEIASTLQISPKTAETHLRRIYEKLGVSKAVVAMRVAIRCGVVAA